MAKQRLDDHARVVADRLIEQLNAGTAPWQRPWEPGQAPSSPYNPTTGKPYRGGNALWLAAQGRDDPRWMTYRQAAAEGAHVRKGEKGVRLQYFIRPDTEKGGDGSKHQPRSLAERPKVVSFTVFNASQIEGLKPLEPRQPLPEWERHNRAELILEMSDARIDHLPGNRAFYNPRDDKIVLPERVQFASPDRYYATALHELGHWTGHESRLDRDLSGRFGSESYAREELRAEIASMMIGDRLSIGHDPGQHAAYVQSWIRALEEDPREIFRAARDAERIQDYVLAFEPEHLREREHQQQAAPEAVEPRQEAAQPLPATGGGAGGADYEDEGMSWG